MVLMSPRISVEIPSAIKRFLWVEMIPLLFIYIPDNGKTLQTATRKGNQVLLKRIPAEGVGDFKLAYLTVRPSGVNKKPAVLAIKAGGCAMDFKNSVVKIPQNGLLIGHGHGMIMVGALPFVVRLLVAVHAFPAAHECRLR